MAHYLLIEMPLPRYDGFVGKLEVPSRAYDIMIAASLDHRPSNDRFTRTMKILCKMEKAEMLLDLANVLYPEAAPDITTAIKLNK